MALTPPIPQNFFIQQGNGQILLAWDQIAGVTSYDVQRSTDNITYASVATPLVPQFLDTTVSINTTYYYKIAATNGSGSSSYTTPLAIAATITGEMNLGQIREFAKQRADMVNSQFVSTSEWNSYINQSYFELYDILTTAYEDYYTAVPLTFQTDGSTYQYPLPNGINYSGAQPFYKMRGVDLGLDSTNNAWVTVHKFNFIARNRYVYPNITSSLLGVFNLRYRVYGNTLYLIPTPAAGQIVRLWYIPRMQTLLQDTDVVNGVSGWTEYIIVDAVIKAMQKEESDVSVLMAQKQMLIDRIQAAASNRDVSEPDTISDVRTDGNMYGYGPNSDGSYGGWLWAGLVLGSILLNALHHVGPFLG